MTAEKRKERNQLEENHIGKSQLERSQLERSQVEENQAIVRNLKGEKRHIKNKYIFKVYYKFKNLITK